MNWDLIINIFNFVWAFVIIGVGIVGNMRVEGKRREIIKDMEHYRNRPDILYSTMKRMSMTKFDIILNTFLFASGNVLVGANICHYLGLV